MSLNPSRILVRGVNWLGDAVMTTPALVRLRERFPDAQIAVLTPEKLAALYLHHPAVDRVLMVSAGESLISVASWLRGESFDLGLIFPNSPRSALELFLGRVPIRVGYARPWRNQLLTLVVKEPADLPRMRKRSAAEVRDRIAVGAARETYPLTGHHTHDYLRLVAALGANPAPIAPCVKVIDAEIESVARRFALPRAGQIVALNAGAEYGPAKRWPEDRFVAVASALHRRTGCSFVLVGGRADTELAERLVGSLARDVPAATVINVAGKTSLRDLCALLRSCHVVITNDTGPMHVAAAVGTPVVVPFGSTSPELTGPGLPGDQRNHLLVGEVPCAPCFLRECPVDFRCMTAISPEQVTRSALQVLQASL
jgi:heptosyltransferase-2